MAFQKGLQYGSSDSKILSAWQYFTCILCKFGEDWSSNPRVTRVTTAPFWIRRQKSAYSTKYLSNYWTDLHLIFSLSRHICRPTGITQEALLWQRDRTTRLPVEILQLQNILLKTRVPCLSCGIICVILRLAVFTQYRSVTDTHTDRQTDGQIQHCVAR